MTSLILVRHGHSTYNGKGVYTGHTDAPLDEVGREQALQLARLLADTHIDAVYTSDLCRTVETVRPTAAQHGLAVCEDAELREIDMGEFTGLPYDEVAQRFPAEYAAFCADIRNPAKGGESIAAAAARILAALQRILAAHEGEQVLICSHALTSRLVYTLAHGGEIADVMKSPLPYNATPVHYHFTDGVFSPA